MSMGFPAGGTLWSAWAHVVENVWLDTSPGVKGLPNEADY